MPIAAAFELFAAPRRAMTARRYAADPGAGARNGIRRRRQTLRLDDQVTIG
jgi:hypothetical protein